MRMTWRTVAGAAITTLVATPIFAQGGIRTERVQFAPGATSATVKATIKGDQTVDYVLGASAGQTMKVSFRSSNTSGYFNVMAPGSEGEALFVGSTSGNTFHGVLTMAGDYTVRVYLMRNAARRNESANYTVTFSITNGPARTAPPGDAPFDRTLALQGVTFHVTSTARGSINQLTITPSGLAIDNSPIIREVEGVVTEAEVSDIDTNGSPEIWVYVTSAGSGSYGSLVAYSANNKKSLSEIYLPPVSQNAKAAKGYMGHDEFRVVENAFVQRFPLYREGDSNAAPSGGMRQLQYKLVPGEAGWVLKLDKVVEY